MVKRIIAFLLLLNLSVVLFAKEDAEEAVETSGKGLDWNIRLGASFPFLPIDSAFSTLGKAGGEAAFLAYTMVTFTLSSFAVGGGLHYTVIPHLLAPGFYVDVHFNVLSWSLVYLFSQNHLVFLQGGIRFYNQFKFGKFSLEPFFGGNFVLAGINDILVPVPLLATGLIFNINTFGIEYGYNFYPSKDARDKLPLLSIHRISLWWKLKLGKNRQ